MSMDHLRTSAARYEPGGWMHWPEYEDYSYQFMRLLGAAQDGASTVGECFLTATRIIPGDDESWHRAVKELGLETCVTLGMLTSERAERLATAGLDFYNHNVDTSPEFYDKIITTRTLRDRLDTLEHVRHVGISICSGSIIGMGEGIEVRLGMLVLLANLPTQPESVPNKLLERGQGCTGSGHRSASRSDRVARLVAVARILMPRAVVRLSAGRQYMTDELQALCFLAGANSIFIGRTAHDEESAARSGCKSSEAARHEL
jgi:biotin synthase-like enzyme